MFPADLLQILFLGSRIVHFTIAKEGQQDSERPVLRPTRWRRKERAAEIGASNGDHRSLASVPCPV